MVDFDLPREMGVDFVGLIPDQRALVAKFFEENTLTSYTLSLDRRKLWATFLAESEEDLIDIIESFPLTKFMEYRIHILMFNQVAGHGMPAISLN